MSEQIASTFGRRVSTTDYVSLLGRRSVEHISPLPPAATDEQEEVSDVREYMT
jgi:hypothetical protein